jgi:hypothetical protein
VVAALRRVGAVVHPMNPDDDEGRPDLLVGFRGETFLIEVKTAKGRLEDSQVAWHSEWRGRPAVVVRDEFEALRAIGALPGG